MAAYIYTCDGWPIGECKIRDVSATGAKLEVAADAEIPNELLLALTRDGAVRRLCRLMWREGSNVGVRFKVD